jgi:hypothetical protein
VTKVYKISMEISMETNDYHRALVVVSECLILENGGWRIAIGPDENPRT